MLNKKGDVSDGIVLLIIFFFLAVSFTVVLFVNDKLHDVVADTPLNQSAAAADISSAMNTMTTTTVQRGFVLMFAILVIGTMVSAFLVRVHPAWLFLYIFFLAFDVFLAILLANTYNSVITNEALATVASQQTMMNWIMKNIVKIIIGVVGLSMIILFAKAPEGGQL